MGRRVSRADAFTPMSSFQCAALVLATLASKNLALVVATAASEAIQAEELAAAARSKPLAQLSSCGLASGRCCFGISKCASGIFLRCSARMGDRMVGLVPLLSKRAVSLAREANPRHVEESAVAPSHGLATCGMAGTHLKRHGLNFKSVPEMFENSSRIFMKHSVVAPLITSVLCNAGSSDERCGSILVRFAMMDA